jgi:hypothetical protein
MELLILLGLIVAVVVMVILLRLGYRSRGT